MAPLSQHESDMHHPDTHNPSVISLSTSSPMAPPLPPQMTFQLVATRLPTELFLMTLKEWIGTQHVVVDSDGNLNYTLSYSNPDNPDPASAIPRPLYTYYIRERVHAWLTDTKDFTDPQTFYLSHLLTSLKLPDHHLPPYDLSSHPLHALSLDPNLTLTTTPPINQPPTLLLPHLSTTTHGFEKIKLDFTAAQYFALFDIRVPPFHYADTTFRGDNLYHDAATHSAGLLLAHTRVLELHFGTAYKSSNPWYDVREHAWCATNPAWPYAEARLRPRVCESGQVVDWIMEYAWYGGYLQHIREIRLTGDVQTWVQEKWEGIVRRQGEYVDANKEAGVVGDRFAVHRPDVVELETIGMVAGEGEDDDGNDEAWFPQNHYPPTCTCEVGCWRLREGRVEEEVVVGDRSWDEVETYGEEVRGDWMDGEELGMDF